MDYKQICIVHKTSINMRKVIPEILIRIVTEIREHKQRKISRMYYKKESIGRVNNNDSSQ